MMTDEHEHAMKVWEEAFAAWDDTPADPNAMHSGDQAAAAVIAADRAGLVPEGCGFAIMGNGAKVGRHIGASSTPALALTAATLRARAKEGV
jgi:hypothetical protein